MDLVALQLRAPTVNEDLSLATFAEILICREDWRCYSSATCAQTMTLIDRYLRAHATTPGWMTEAMVAFEPVQVLAGRGPSYTLWGVVFLNGAVLQVANATDETWLLYVADATAQCYGYPQGWVRTTEFFGRIDDATPVLRS